MKLKYPILIIIPHGGRTVPDELSGYEQIDEFGIFIESDAYANELFRVENAAFILSTEISKLFIDLDRPPGILPPSSSDGIIKKESLNGRKIFKDNIFPDEIAAANILKRYYNPFHNSIREAIKSGQIKLILECHTMMPVGPRYAKDAGKPRPIINIENTIKTGLRTMKTCPTGFTENILLSFKKYFNDEEYTVTEKFSMNNPEFDGYIFKEYSQQKIPMIRLSISTSLFLNEKYFNYNSLTVDNSRIDELSKMISAGIDRFAPKYLM